MTIRLPLVLALALGAAAPALACGPMLEAYVLEPQITGTARPAEDNSRRPADERGIWIWERR